MMKLLLPESPPRRLPLPSLRSAGRLTSIPTGFTGGQQLGAPGEHAGMWSTRFLCASRRILHSLARDSHTHEVCTNIARARISFEGGPGRGAHSNQGAADQAWYH
jgi:hypothetical protein